MSLQSSKSDQDFRKMLIANQDILLSPNLEQQNDLPLDFFSFLNSESMINQQTVETDNNLNTSNENDSLDCMFEILQADDPEVVSLLETLNRSDFQLDFLPQISINTASKVLEDTEQETRPKFENNQTDEQLYQTIQLKTECESPDEAMNPNMVQNQASTRASLRLLTKKDRKNTKNETNKSKKGTNKIKSERILNTLKRKRSFDDDDSSYNSSENDSVDYNKHYLVAKHDNSVDFESDEHIYYDDDDDEVASNENAFYNSDDDEDQEFKNYVRSYNLSNRNRKKMDPTKKESNKEAATRYRLKKLTEKERLFETRMGMESENNDVKRKIEIAQTEINYLKNLLVQMLLTKGVLGTKI